MDAVSHDAIASIRFTPIEPTAWCAYAVSRRLWEHPHTNNTIWLARATPRAWLAEGETIRVADAPCSLGRLSYVLRSEIDSSGCITANVSLALHKTARKSGNVVGVSGNIVGVSGGAVLRLRTPGRRTIASVHAGDISLQPNRWNVTDESITFAEGEQLAQLVAAPVRVCYD